MTSFNIDQWLSGEEGTRAQMELLPGAREWVHGGRCNEFCPQREDHTNRAREMVRWFLRAALSLTTTCATCGGTGDTAPFTRELTHPCPDCKGGTERLHSDAVHVECARHLRLIANDVRSAGDVPLVRLSEDGVAREAVTLADELWLVALRLDPDGAFPLEKEDET